MKDERAWLINTAIPRLLTTRMKVLNQLLEKLGYENISSYTDTTLNLHDYQYHGLDVEGVLSKYLSRESAAVDVISLVSRLIEIIEQRVKQRLTQYGKWQSGHEELLKKVHEYIQHLARQ